jgi:hypothetical protein
VGTGLKAPVQGPSPRVTGGLAKRRLFLLEECSSIREVNPVTRTVSKPNVRYHPTRFSKLPIKRLKLSSQFSRAECTPHRVQQLELRLRTEEGHSAAVNHSRSVGETGRVLQDRASNVWPESSRLASTLA